MGAKSKIEWTDASWNPIRGCSRVSEGCRNCYAERVAARFSGPGKPYEGLAVMKSDGPHWTGEVRLNEEALELPLRWRKPRKIFVNSMSDLFHESVPDEWISKVMRIMTVCIGRHTFQILTKRPERMLAWYTGPQPRLSAVLPHVWLGVSVEDQATADERVPLLLQTPAAVRWVSYEPALGPVSLQWRWVSHGKPLGGGPACNVLRPWEEPQPLPALDWIVVGGESGPRARPMHPDWARSVRDQCLAAGVPFFFKQWGAWIPQDHPVVPGSIKDQSIGPERCVWLEPEGSAVTIGKGGKSATNMLAVRVGKKAAGRLLDGREWNEFPP